MKSKRKKIINILIEFIFQALFLRMHFLFFFQVLFIYFWLCWVFAAAKAFSLGVASGGYCLVMVYRLLTVVAFAVVEHGLQGAQASAVAARGLNSCSSWALEQTQLLWCSGLAAPRHVGSSQIRD